MLDNRESARVKFHFLWDSLSFRTKLLDDLLFSFVLVGFWFCFVFPFCFGSQILTVCMMFGLFGMMSSAPFFPFRYWLMFVVFPVSFSLIMCALCPDCVGYVAGVAHPAMTNPLTPITHSNQKTILSLLACFLMIFVQFCYHFLLSPLLLNKHIPFCIVTKYYRFIRLLAVLCVRMLRHGAWINVWMFYVCLFAVHSIAQPLYLAIPSFLCLYKPCI